MSIRKVNIMKKNKIKNFIKEYMKWTPSRYVVILILLLPLMIMSIKPFKLDNDFWFLVNTGKYIINNGIPYIEPFTIHTNFSFVAQQWLTDIIFYVIYKYTSVYGMYFLTFIFNALIVYLTYRLALLVSNNKTKLSLVITVVVDILYLTVFITTRPQIFDILLFTLEIYILELYIRKDNKKYLLLLPIISLLMINLHSSFYLMLFVLLLPYYVGRINTNFTTKTTYKLKPIIIVTIMMFLTGFINPYGLKGVTYLFNSYGIKEINNFIIEMQPSSIKNSLATYIYIFLIIVSYYINKEKKINLRYLLLILGTTLLTLMHIKGTMYLLLASVLVICDNFKYYFNEEKTLSSKKNNYLTIVCIILFIVVISVSNINKKYYKEEDSKLYEISNILKEDKNTNLKIYTSYNDGGYIEYMGFKSYIDPRAEVFIKKGNKQEDIFKEYYNLQYGQINCKVFLDKYNFDYLVINSYDILNTYIDDYNEYTMLYNKNDELKLYKRVVN